MKELDNLTKPKMTMSLRNSTSYHEIMRRDIISSKMRMKPGQGKSNTWPLATATISVREGSGTPLQYSCLENPMGGGAW